MICLRLDLDYVPWDSANAEKYGHGEPAMVLKLLGLARQKGTKFHFFASNRSLRTFPTLADSILGEGHDLDWLTHYPDDPDLYEEAKKLFALAGHKFQGVATTRAWPEDFNPEWLQELTFVSAPPGHTPQGPTFFEVSGRFDDEALPLGLGNRSEIDFESLQEAEDLARIITLVARPQVLAKQDPLLHRLSTILLGQLTVRTLRDAVRT